MPKRVNLDTVAKIYRDRLTKATSLHIKTSDSWSIYAGKQVDSIDLIHPILVGSGGGVFVLPVDPTIRSYFKLVVGIHSAILAERILPMEGGFNFRDLGGIELKDGRSIKWGKLFRADELANLTDNDTYYLASIPIRSVIDFRSESEIRKAPDRLPPSAQFSYPMKIAPGALRTEGIDSSSGKASFSSQMRQMNRLYVSDPACIRIYRIMFTIIQNSLSAPLVFHCSAGKDRTGMAAALVLFALGASEQTVIDDYMVSKHNIPDKYIALVEKFPRTEPIFTVKRSYIVAGINQIKREHGSIMNFLTTVLKVDIPKIRRLYLEPRK